MILYRGLPEEDALIAGWWARMERDGDLDKVFAAGSRTMRALFQLVTPPKGLFYEVDEVGLWGCVWFEPLLDGVCVGAWFRSDTRKSRKILYAFLEVLDRLLIHAAVVIGITKQPGLIPLHERLGYTVLGEIPRLFDGETATMLTVTRERLEPVLRRYRRVSSLVEVA